MICTTCNVHLPENWKGRCPCGGKSDRCQHLGKPTTPIKVKCKNGYANQKANKCLIHRICLPYYRPTAEWDSRPEAELIQLCVSCKDFKKE